MNDFNQVMQSDKESERKVRERLFNPNPNPFALERMRIKDNHQTVSAMPEKINQALDRLIAQRYKA